MKNSRFSEEQIIGVLKEADARKRRRKHPSHLRAAMPTPNGADKG